MHKTSMELMKSFVQRYLKKRCRVADIGSFDYNGSYKLLFEDHDYTGLDINEGPNVDRIVKKYDFGTEQYDIVISGQVLEHVPDLCRWRDAAMKIVKPGGLICVVAPHTWPLHRYPQDCWRIFPDGMRWLFQDYDIRECKMNKNDTMLVARNAKAI